jgi:hypothetical protein
MVAAVLVVIVAAGLLSLPGGLKGSTSTSTSTTTTKTTTAPPTTTISGPSSSLSVTSTAFFSPSVSTISANLTVSTVTVIIPKGATFQVQSSFDCLAGNFAQPFNVTASSLLEGGIGAPEPGVTLYVSTARDAQTTDLGHPASWVYTSGLTDATTFSIPLSPGSYVLWTEGADMRCGAKVVTPLEQMTTVIITQAVTVAPR